MKIKKFLLKLSLLLLLFIFAIAGYFLTLPAGSVEENLSLKARILSDKKQVVAEPYVLGLSNPWGMVFLPNGDILVTERAGSIRVIREGRLLEETINAVPEVYARGQGGLLDIALHPNFKNNNFIYLSYSHVEDEGSHTSILRARLDNFNLLDKKLIYKAQPSTSSDIHFGSRLAFDNKGYLYFSIGERGDRDVNPQDLTRDGGKIYRLHDDGRIPEDNPFINVKEAKTAAFTYGNRNPQGLALNPNTGEIWEHEHGPRGGDEINIIRAGLNYGWPIISYGINYSGTEFAEDIKREGMEQPISYWVPSIAPSGMAFIVGDKYPGWEGDLIVGSLKFGYLVRVHLEDNQVISQEKVAEGIGRVRNVVLAPDGYLYVGIEGQGIYRLSPQSQTKKMGE